MRNGHGRGLRLTRLELSNWRNFSTVDVELPQRVFLVGPNASGKSNLLDVFRFLHDLVKTGGGFEKAVADRDGISKLRSLYARTRSSVSISVSLGNDEDPNRWRYELEFNQEKSRGPVILKEVVVHSGKEVLSRPDADDQSDPARLSQTHLEQINVNRDFREIADFFKSVRYLHVVPQLIREPDRSVGRVDDPYGGDFLEQIAQTPKRTQQARLRRILRALRIAVPQLSELEFRRDEGRGVPHLRGKFEHWRPQGAWQEERQFSDGTLRLVGLLWALLDGGGPALLEEPELSLHPGVIRHLPVMFSRIQSVYDRQIFISTHSPEILFDPGIGLDELLLLMPSSEGTRVKSAISISEIRKVLDSGGSLPDFIMSMTKPADAHQLTLFQ